MTEPKTDGFKKGDGAQKAINLKKKKKKRLNKLNGKNYLPRKRVNGRDRMVQKLNGWISDKDDGLALTMCFLRKVEK